MYQVCFDRNLLQKYLNRVCKFYGDIIGGRNRCIDVRPFSVKKISDFF